MLQVNNIFFDFDGVIKDSVEVKTEAFLQLFEPFGLDIAKKIKNHHEANGGMSRFEKIPIYLEWVGEIPSRTLINSYSEEFSQKVKQKVIDSKWVPGILEFLQSKKKEQNFFLVTATPQKETEQILSIIGIKHYFKEVIGAPTKKDNAIKILLKKYSILPDNSVMIGDSHSDYNAAKVNNIPFILRRTELNVTLQKSLDCCMIYNFLL